MLRYAKSDSDLCLVLSGKFISRSPNTQQHDHDNLVTPPPKKQKKHED